MELDYTSKEDLENLIKQNSARKWLFRVFALVPAILTIIALVKWVYFAFGKAQLIENFYSQNEWFQWLWKMSPEGFFRSNNLYFIIYVTVLGVVAIVPCSYFSGQQSKYEGKLRKHMEQARDKDIEERLRKGSDFKARTQ